MSRITELFTHKKNKVLNVYCTAGYPAIDSTLPVLRALQESGADMVEIGIPYSDPLADGPVIQESSARALTNGMTIARLFEQLQSFRKEIHMPVVLMGYLNPILQFGFEKFCNMAASTGIDGIIVPDLPEYEFENFYGATIKKYGLDFIFLVTPETSAERIRKFDLLSAGFLYAVSSSSTTGSAQDSGNMKNYLERLSLMQLKNPILVGFGIKDRESFELACQYANGAIIGTAYITAIGKADQSENVKTATQSFLSSILS